ncbi:transcriptional regulator [Flavobacterium psychrophilum]|uniref:Probable transcriptional regulator, TetR family n=1 Tax=Flavobacterium psychrophilum (strain ATCC 49511 / DSM 21280 / CIP 103535 / JIP02/86) TaxID=402612 RepID=A6GZY2_FLAPJ|nr:TetR/AcrR family transcriptional regulator [Flavobacterium psychrophilum]AIG30346.1 transcriptional regulator [Flavobacterium psychrophilum]AIG32621.1 transcriptional regulator [Flavobacterium psychrophilum]AIG34776.1 transcriptional regulator [Flavobacterium psychrophilum]AIG37141.1 transcriptional regulator [Flavobacterium psychrophilum]AIG39405.1 transcriptional regulator [Flavobacterium psychrophilum]
MSKAERTKQFIIEKTAPIFNAKGYMGTSMNDIMNATGLTKGSIYGNFENKDEVALAAFDYNFGAIVSYIKPKIEVRPKMIDKLLVYPETYRNFLKLSFLEAGCPVLNTSTEADDTHPMLRKRAVNALKLWQTSIEKYIEIGIETKEIKANTNAVEFSAILMSLIEGAVMQAKVTGNSRVLNITMNFLEKMIKDLKA